MLVIQEFFFYPTVIATLSQSKRCAQAPSLHVITWRHTTLQGFDNRYHFWQASYFFLMKVLYWLNQKVVEQREFLTISNSSPDRHMLPLPSTHKVVLIFWCCSWNLSNIWNVKFHGVSTSIVSFFFFSLCCCTCNTPNLSKAFTLWWNEWHNCFNFLHSPHLWLSAPQASVCKRNIQCVVQ